MREIPFALVTLMWVYLTLPFFFLKELCTIILILDFNRSCGIEMESVEKPNVWTHVAARTSGCSSDEKKLLEHPHVADTIAAGFSVAIPHQSILYGILFRILVLLTPLRLVLVLQYLTNPSFMVLCSLVRRHERYGRFYPSSDISNPIDVMN